MKSRQGSSNPTIHRVTSCKADSFKTKFRQGLAMSTTYRVTSSKEGRSKMKSRQALYVNHFQGDYYWQGRQIQDEIQAGLLHVNHLQGD